MDPLFPHSVFCDLAASSNNPQPGVTGDYFFRSLSIDLPSVAESSAVNLVKS